MWIGDCGKKECGSRKTAKPREPVNKLTEKISLLSIMHFAPGLRYIFPNSDLTPDPYQETYPMGFIRQQEEKLAVRFLSWQYEKLKKPIPNKAELAIQAEKIVEEAHRIARERGRNVVSIIKDLITDVKK
jgi:hypothetical protein